MNLAYYDILYRLHLCNPVYNSTIMHVSCIVFAKCIYHLTCICLIQATLCIIILIWLSIPLHKTVFSESVWKKAFLILLGHVEPFKPYTTIWQFVLARFYSLLWDVIRHKHKWKAWGGRDWILTFRHLSFRTTLLPCTWSITFQAVFFSLFWPH